MCPGTSGIAKHRRETSVHGAQEPTAFSRKTFLCCRRPNCHVSRCRQLPRGGFCEDRVGDRPSPKKPHAGRLRRHFPPQQCPSKTVSTVALFSSLFQSRKSEAMGQIWTAREISWTFWSRSLRPLGCQQSPNLKDRRVLTETVSLSLQPNPDF